MSNAGEVGVRTNVYETWSQFKSQFAADLFGVGPLPARTYAFRGQRSADWQLVSRFDRVYAMLPVERRPDVARRLLEEFHRHVLTYIDGAADFGTYGMDERFAVMAVAQHYGLPTRLLDWSRSPYVAAFFAFSEALTKPLSDDCPMVAIWAIDTTHGIWSRENGVELMDVPTRVDQRIRNQGGLFTHAVAAMASIEEYLMTMAPRERALSRFLVPRSEATTAIADLAAMDIHPARMFPGYEGCVRAAMAAVTIQLANSG